MARFLFLLFAPLTVPVYLLALAYVNLTGIAYFLVGDMTIGRLTGRPFIMPPGAFWLLSPIIIVVAVLVLIVHLVIWSVCMVVAGMEAAGRWQTGVQRGATSFVLGAIWTAVFLWCVTFSIDGIAALRMVGRDIPGRVEFSESTRKRLRLGDLPPSMQERRSALIDSLRSGRPNQEDTGHLLIDLLSDDKMPFEALYDPLQLRLAGIPWYFVPQEFSFDGSPHCLFLLGLLLITLLLMIRWPGMHHFIRGPTWRMVSYVFRVGMTLAAAAYHLSWSPPGLLEERTALDAGWRGVLAPLAWMNVDPTEMFPPQWVTLNFAAWLLLGGLAFLLWLMAARLHAKVGLPRYYSAFLAARLLQRKRIAFFSIGAVTLCVAMLLIVISVMDGFVETISTRARGLLGDLVMDGGLTGFPYYEEFNEMIRGWPEVKQATALIYSYGTLRFEGGETFAVQVWGITLDEYCGVNDFCKDLFYEQHYPGTTVLGAIQAPLYGYNSLTGLPVLPEPYESALQTWLRDQPAETREQYTRVPGGYFPGPGVYRINDDEGFQPTLSGRPYPGAIVGREIIAQRTPSGDYRRPERFPRGCVCVITMLPLTRTGLILSEPPPAPAFRYIDDSRTGIYEIDSKNVYVDFHVLQEKLAMNALPRAEGEGVVPPRCSQIQIKLEPGVDVLRMKRRVDEAWMNFASSLNAEPADRRLMNNVRVSTWEEMQSGFIAAIKKEKVLVVVMFSVISVVAVFLVLCIFYMIVLEKTRDIGIVKSVGGSAEGVAAIFLTYGAAIGIVGSLLGSAIGYLFVRNINGIQDWLARLNPEWRVWSPETYSFDKIPDVVNMSDVVFISIAAVLASIIGAVVPAIRASRTWPVEALRYE